MLAFVFVRRGTWPIETLPYEKQWGITFLRCGALISYPERLPFLLTLTLLIFETAVAMLPKIYPPYPERDDVDVYGQLTPAKEVGGDLFDFYIRDEKLFFSIGDVSGKGVPASLYMVITRALFRTISAHESSPERIISNLNDVMSKDNESNMFVTMFVGVLDLPTGRLHYCNAGHDAPLLIGNTGAGLLPVDSMYTDLCRTSANFSEICIARTAALL